MAGIIFCVCSAFTFTNPVGQIFYQKAHNYYDKKNYKSAFINYKKASDLGIPKAQYYLANMYLEGQGSTKNKTEAIMWLKKSADGGFSPAQVAMGLRNQFGIDVAKDLAKAYNLFLLAAKADDPDGQYYLAILIATGQGTVKNSKKALEWFRIAQSNGFPVPQNLLSPDGVALIDKKEWRENKKSTGHNLVWQIQSNLSKLGYNPGPVDGLIGKKTKAAIRLFQEKNGLVIDGEPSELLLTKIKNIY